MANAIHQTGTGETLAGVTALYYAVRQSDGRHDDAVAAITTAIRKATPPALVDLSDVGETESLPAGSTLFVPTLRAFNRIVFANDERLLKALARKGFDHARKLLRYGPEQVIELLSPLPPEYSRDALSRAWTLTAFLNLDGMDRYTAQHLFDVTRIQSLQELARTDRASLEKTLEALVAGHGRPQALLEQRHAERWILEAKILTRKRVSEVAKARGRLFRVPFAPAVAERAAAFYESSSQDDAVTNRESTLSARLGRLHRFQEAVLRGNLCLASGRWSAAVDAYQQARRHWHRLAEETGAARRVEDTDGVNLRTAIDTAQRILQALPGDDDRPLGAPPTDLRGRQSDRSYRLRSFRYDELNADSQRELQARLSGRRVHELPERFRTAVQRTLLEKTRAELERADPMLVEGLVPGAGTARMRDFESRDREVLRRNVASAPVEVLSARRPGSQPLHNPGGVEVEKATATPQAPLNVFDAVGDTLAISEVEPLVSNLWSERQPAGPLLSEAAASRYPKAFLARNDVTPFTKFVVLPGASGAGDLFVPLSGLFLADYETRVLKPRLLSRDGNDAGFDERCWSNAGAFAAIAPYLYAVELPLALRRAYSRLGRRDLAGRYGGLRINVYDSNGTLVHDLGSTAPSDLVFDLDLYACSSHWVDPATVEPEFAIYVLDIAEYARWYIDVADHAYAQDDRSTARSWYADVICAIETYWGDNDLAVQAQSALRGVRSSIAAIGDGQLNASVQSLSTLNVQYEAGGVVGKVMKDHILVTGRNGVRTGPTPRPPRHAGGRGTARSSRNGGGGVDFDVVSVELDRTLVDTSMQIGGFDILINEIGEGFELYARYLYCSAKLAAIDAGLNWYGLPDSYVPPWSFQHLYGLARELCNRALDAERNTFALLQTLEAAQREVLQASQTLEMANETLALAQARVTQQQAANELSWTQAAIAFNQAGLAEQQNEMQGTIDLLTGWAGFLFNPLGSGGQFASGVTSLANSALYEQLTDLSNEAWQQMEALNEAALAVAIAERDVVRLSAQQASEYLAFLQLQTLDVGAYDYLLALSREVTEHYLEHANRLSWLAQRALSHETRQTFELVRLSYATGEELMDLTQAQRLTAGLESVLATYTAGQSRRHQEIKWTVALSQLSPGALQALRTSGTGMFVLTQESLDMFFPGHYLHSLKDVAMTVVGTLPPTGVRGVLQSSGVSWVRVPNDGSHEDGSDTAQDWPTPHLADASHAANPDFDGYDAYILKMIRSMGTAVSLSQFDVQRDRAVLSLPQGMLSSVQHLGLNTAWTLALHRQANAFEFAQIQDVELTFWFQAALDAALAGAQYEALVRKGRRGELQASATVLFVTDHPEPWMAFTGDAASPETVDLRLLAVDVGGLPLWEAARRVTNILVACARSAGATDELTLRLCCAHDPVGYRFTTTAGSVFSAVGLPHRSNDPRSDDDFTAWVKAGFHGRSAAASPAMRWVLKAAPRQIGSGWLARNEDGIAVTTKSGALRVLPTSSTSATAIFSDGSAWSDVFLKARVAHHGGTLRLRVRNTDLAHYAAEISASGVRLLRVTNGVETTLAQRALAYPGDEFLFVELGVVGQMLRLSVDTISIFDDVATGGAVAAGTIALEALNSRSASQAVEFDDVQVVRVTKLWAEAETLLAEPFTASLPANWTFKTAGMPWAIDPGGHERLDLRSLQNLTLKIDYAHEMVESPS